MTAEVLRGSNRLEPFSTNIDLLLTGVCRCIVRPTHLSVALRLAHLGVWDRLTLAAPAQVFTPSLTRTPHAFCDPGIDMTLIAHETERDCNEPEQVVALEIQRLVHQEL